MNVNKEKEETNEGLFIKQIVHVFIYIYIFVTKEKWKAKSL